MKRILYVTFDGILQPLGYAQVARMVAGLAERGLPYALLSVERSQDLADEARVQRIESWLSSVGVGWNRVRADLVGSARASVSAIGRVMAAAMQMASRGEVSLIHARGYQSAGVARAVKAVTGTPYVFDARGCWIEERSGAGDWFSAPGRYATGKLVERKLFASAGSIVTLTNLQATDIRAIVATAPCPVDVVPTCADYDAFPLRPSRPATRASSPAVPAQVQATLRGKAVIGIVGSLNISYFADASIELARLATEVSRDAHLLILSKQREEFDRLLRKSNFPADRVTLGECRHDEVAEWMQWIDWGLLLLPDVAAKRGSMPTKLAEFFATGVRPIAHGCNSEMMSWVRRAGSGIALDAIDASSLRHAAATVAQVPADIASLERARVVTEPHFGLRQGIERYERLLRPFI